MASVINAVKPRRGVAAATADPWAAAGARKTRCGQLLADRRSFLMLLLSARGAVTAATATAGQPGIIIPAGACWKYDSATISPTDIIRWNNSADSWNTTPITAQRDYFDSTNQEYKLRKPSKYQAPTMSPEGYLVSTRNFDWIDEHAQVEMSRDDGNACSPVLHDSGASGGLLDHVHYRSGFLAKIPAVFGKQNEEHQLYQIGRWAGAGPDVSISAISTTLPAHFRLILRGLERPGGGQNIVKRLAFGKSINDNKFHSFAFDFILDPGGEADGFFSLTYDGVEIYNSQTELMGPLDLGTATRKRATAPRFGVYAPNGSTVTLTATLDKIWFMAV